MNKNNFLKVYRPLTVVVGVVLLASLALQMGRGSWQLAAWMHDFMGLFLIVFSMFKLFDIAGFTEGFKKYDLIAGRADVYGLVYPFIELFLGLAYLGRIWPSSIYLLTFVIMTIGAIGVIRALAKGLDVRCACLGTVLNVPLSTVAVVEDAGMGLMALGMLFIS